MLSLCLILGLILDEKNKPRYSFPLKAQSLFPLIVSVEAGAAS
jgi:hypothetical protein